MAARELMRRYLDLARAGDWEQAFGFFADDVVIHIPCRSAHAGEERVALIVRERFRRPGGDVEIRRANVYRIEDEHIVEVWIFEHDQYAVDELMAELRLDD